MMKRPLRVLFVSSHPVQYATPIFRLLANDPRIEIQVAYCSMQGAEREIDPDFQVEVKWDIALMDGYPWLCLPNRFRKPDLGSFFGLFNTGIWRLIRRGNFDAVVLYTGYVYAAFWIAVAAAKASGTAVLFGTDATSFQPRDRKRWKVYVKKLLLPLVFRLANVVIMPSEAGRQFMLSMKIPESRVILTPFVVDNAWWQQRASEVDRRAVRKEWNIPDDATVVAFCAKLQTWKRPQDALRAFAKADVKGAYLVFAGEGSLRSSLEREAKALGISERVRFLGFVNQTGLPAVYRSSDLLIMASEYDPCPVVVCEAMLCGCPVMLSDEIRGRFDLVRDGQTGSIYPCGDIGVLARIMSNMLQDPDRLERLSRAALARMETWSPRESVDATVRALQKACNV
jgi:glycosyltransferase involved in cell wall biosynthesis